VVKSDSKIILLPILQLYPTLASKHDNSLHKKPIECNIYFHLFGFGQSGEQEKQIIRRGNKTKE